MTVNELLSVGVAAVGVVSATLVGLAHAGDQGRKWAKSAALQLLAYGFYALLIIFSIGAVWGFGAAPGAPTRGEILILLLWVFNGSMGIVFTLTDLLQRKRAQRAQSS